MGGRQYSVGHCYWIWTSTGSSVIEFRHIMVTSSRLERVLTLARGQSRRPERVKTSLAAFSSWLEGQAESSEEDEA